jgi:DDE domain
MVVSIAGRQMYMWRAVDSEGEVLEIIVQPQRDKVAALRLLRKLLRHQGFVPALSIAPLIAPLPVWPMTRVTLAPDSLQANSILPRMSKFSTLPATRQLKMDKEFSVSSEVIQS